MSLIKYHSLLQVVYFKFPNTSVLAAGSNLWESLLYDIWVCCCVHAVSLIVVNFNNLIIFDIETCVILSCGCKLSLCMLVGGAAANSRSSVRMSVSNAASTDFPFVRFFRVSTSKTPNVPKVPRCTKHAVAGAHLHPATHRTQVERGRPLEMTDLFLGRECLTHDKRNRKQEQIIIFQIRIREDLFDTAEQPQTAVSPHHTAHVYNPRVQSPLRTTEYKNLPPTTSTLSLARSLLFPRLCREFKSTTCITRS